MTFSGHTTRTVATPNQSTRNGVTPTFIVLHHMATTGFDGVLNSWATGRKQGSAHYAISNGGEVVGVVPEEYRAWSLSSASFDSKSIVFEIANESVGGSWPVSGAAQEATAKVVADLSRRYGIPLNRDRVIGHREVYTRHGAGYATACPGGLNMDWIVARANELLGNAAPAPSAPASQAPAAPAAGGGWAYWAPNGTGRVRRVQAALKARGRYNGRVDDWDGPLTRMGIQKTLAISGEFVGLIDGIIEGGGCLGMQTYGKRFGDYTGWLDSRPREQTWDAFALGLERP